MKFFSEKMKSLLEAKKNKQAGFTLLELLVVVAILAAIAGTASIALKDTDARASAAAHVAMMDELNKGLQTYRALNRSGTFPNRLDSLMSVATAAAGTIEAAEVTDATLSSTMDFYDATPADHGVHLRVLTEEESQLLIDNGVTELRFIDELAQPQGYNAAANLTCSPANIEALIQSKTNDNFVVAGNIFMGPAGNGCGASYTLDAGTGVAQPMMAFWLDGTERLTGQEDGTPAVAGVYNRQGNGNHEYLLTGIGPSSTLFDTNIIGSMTTVPVYRHVTPTKYNRFIAVWRTGTWQGGALVTSPVLDLITILDTALDTKEEELGEWDGTRQT